MRESTKPFTFKFKQSDDGVPTRFDSFGNPADFQSENEQLIENSLFNNKAGLQEISKKAKTLNIF